MLWDIFCRVIDNFGDIGVCWRLGSDLAARGEQVRLWVDDASALQWMAPLAASDPTASVQVLPWHHAADEAVLAALPAADVWIEAFGCELEACFVAHFVQRTRAATGRAQAVVWLNLEYLSAERFVERAHRLPSPVLHGPACGWVKYFFYPGFSAHTGGLLREPHLARQQSGYQAKGRSAWLAQQGLHAHAASPAPERLISLFCYAPAGLAGLLDALEHDAHHHTHLLVTPGHASTALRALWGEKTQGKRLRVSYLPLRSQAAYDELLWHCDINFVRGEDSLVRAIWAGKPFVWNIYPQEDGAHLAKLHAFLNSMDASAPLRSLHTFWNHGTEPSSTDASATVFAACPPFPAWEPWAEEVQKLKNSLYMLPDLVTSIVQFVHKNR